MTIPQLVVLQRAAHCDGTERPSGTVKAATVLRRSKLRMLAPPSAVYCIATAKGIEPSSFMEMHIVLQAGALHLVASDISL